MKSEYKIKGVKISLKDNKQVVLITAVVIVLAFIMVALLKVLAYAAAIICLLIIAKNLIGGKK